MYRIEIIMRFKVQNLNSIDELKKYSIYLYKTELVIYLGYNKYTHIVFINL